MNKCIERIVNGKTEVAIMHCNTSSRINMDTAEIISPIIMMALTILNAVILYPSHNDRT